MKGGVVDFIRFIKYFTIKFLLSSSCILPSGRGEINPIRQRRAMILTGQHVSTSLSTKILFKESLLLHSCYSNY